jgi:glycosyltransferase involved in cell wall biosynthesis
MKTLHVVPDLQPGTSARELQLLCADFWRRIGMVQVCCLGRGGPAGDSLRTVCVPVETLDWTRPLDPRPLWHLARRLRTLQPDIVCAWGLTALRAVRAAAPFCPWAIVVRRLWESRPKPWALSALDQWLLKRVDRIVVNNLDQARRVEQVGILADKVCVAPPAVGVSRPFGDTQPAKARIVCAGALVPHNGFYEALWTFDILHFVVPEVELLIAGDGPERRRLEQFVDNIGLRHRIELNPAATDLPALLAGAAVVWVPSLTDSGAGLALEAMAAGRAVVASRWPGLAQVVVDGETGFLVEPGSKVELARQTRGLLDNAGLRRRLGEAGRRRVEQHFAAESLRCHWADLCQELAA